METVVVHDAKTRLDEEMLATRGIANETGRQCDQCNRTHKLRMRNNNPKSTSITVSGKRGKQERRESGKRSCTARLDLDRDNRGSCTRERQSKIGAPR